ncbi:hypothetical protein DESA109040_07530 [Deinococcus saxicola]|uniref:hypothetical protein n=1 Tax=Deinococcus saxicola TaxID=249406 RepID=UPI0039F0A597
MRLFAATLIPLMLMSCTSSELGQLFPPDNQGNAASPAGPVTVSAQNPGAGGTACDVLNVALTVDQTQVAQSPDLVRGSQWFRVLSAAELAGKTRVQLRASCSISVTDTGGTTVTRNGYSVSDHAVIPAAQTLTVTGPRTGQNLAGRVEWATPVPGVLPLDP